MQSKEYYREVKTMTAWEKVGDTFRPIGEWRIDRDWRDVLKEGIFSGPYSFNHMND